MTTDTIIKESPPEITRGPKADMGEIVYESHKHVLIAGMNRLRYNNYRGWKLPLDEDGSDEGYLVEYLDGGEPNDSRHKGYISWTPKQQFVDDYTKVSNIAPPITKEDELFDKSLGNTDLNTTKSNVSDLVVWGDDDLFKLISKASSKNEGWMKSTKAMEIPGLGCAVQVTTQQGDNVAEAVTFVPGVEISETMLNGEVVNRKLTRLT